MNIRKNFYFKNHSKFIGFEFSTPTKYWYPIGIGIEFNEEREITIHFSFFFSLYIILGRIFKYYPQRYSKTYGSLNTDKSIYIDIHKDVIRWCFWVEEDTNIGDYPKIRKGSFYFIDYIFGTLKYERKEIEKTKHVTSFLEGSFLTEVTKYEVYGRRKRWFTTKYISYNVNCDKVDESHNITFGFDRKIKNAYDAALEFEINEKRKNGGYISLTTLRKKYKNFILNNKEYFILNEIKDKYLVFIYDKTCKTYEYVNKNEIDRALKLNEITNPDYLTMSI